MTKESVMRMTFNIILAILGITSIALAVFISQREYRNYKIPEIYTDEQVENQVIQDFSENNFTLKDIQDIEIDKADDNRSFSANINISKEAKLCKNQYSVQYSFQVIDGEWIMDEESKSLIAKNPEWQLQDSTWSATLEDGSEYRVHFSSVEEAIVNVNEVEKTEESDNIVCSISDETCKLESNKDGSEYIGTLQRPDETTITLIVNTDEIKLDLDNEEGEIILKKE